MRFVCRPMPVQGAARTDCPLSDRSVRRDVLRGRTPRDAADLQAKLAFATNLSRWFGSPVAATAGFRRASRSAKSPSEAGSRAICRASNHQLKLVANRNICLCGSPSLGKSCESLRSCQMSLRDNRMMNRCSVRGAGHDLYRDREGRGRDAHSLSGLSLRSLPFFPPPHGRWANAILLHHPFHAVYWTSQTLYPGAGISPS